MWQRAVEIKWLTGPFIVRCIVGYRFYIDSLWQFFVGCSTLNHSIHFNINGIWYCDVIPYSIGCLADHSSLTDGDEAETQYSHVILLSILPRQLAKLDQLNSVKAKSLNYTVYIHYFWFTLSKTNDKIILLLNVVFILTSTYPSKYFADFERKLLNWQ